MRRLPVLALVFLAAAGIAAADPITQAGLVPEAGPHGSYAFPFIPQVLPGVTDAAAADYLRPDGRRVGALLAGRTAAGVDPEVVSAEFVRGAVRARSSRVMAGGTFIVLTILQDGGGEVFAMGFSARFEDGSALVNGGDSVPTEGDVLVIAWAETADAAAELIAASLARLVQSQTLGFASDSPRAAPTIAAPSVYPNPCAHGCTVEIDLADAGYVILDALDMTGRRVATLASGAFEAGSHRFDMLLRGLPPGLFVVRMVVDGHVSTRRVTRVN